MMGWEAVSVLTFHQHGKYLPRSRGFLEGPIPVNGLHGFVKNHHVLGQGGHDAVCESLVAPGGNRGVCGQDQALEARLYNKPSKLTPDQGAAGGSGPSSAREELREGGGLTGGLQEQSSPGFREEQVPPHPAQGSHSGHLPHHSTLPMQGSPGGSHEGPVRGQPPQHRAGLSAHL